LVLANTEKSIAGVASSSIGFTHQPATPCSIWLKWQTHNYRDVRTSARRNKHCKNFPGTGYEDNFLLDLAHLPWISNNFLIKAS